MITIDQLIKGLEQIAEEHGSRDIPVKMHLQVQKDVKEGWAVIPLLCQTGFMTQVKEGPGYTGREESLNIALIAAHLEETEPFAD